jgi:hypothetical protein
MIKDIVIAALVIWIAMTIIGQAREF